MSRILVTGGRDYARRDVVAAALQAAQQQWDDDGQLTVVHGAALGADTIAQQLADEWGWATEAWPADWKRHGRAAGHRRNAAMVATGPDICLAFLTPGSANKGTRGCGGLARAAGIPMRVHDDEGRLPPAAAVEAIGGVPYAVRHLTPQQLDVYLWLHTDQHADRRDFDAALENAPLAVADKFAVTVALDGGTPLSERARSYAIQGAIDTAPYYELAQHSSSASGPTTSATRHSEPSWMAFLPTDEEGQLDQETARQVITSVYNAAYQVGYDAARQDDVTPIAERTRIPAGPSRAELLALRGETEDADGNLQTLPREGDYPGGPVLSAAEATPSEPARAEENAARAVTDLAKHRAAAERRETHNAADAYRQQQARWHADDTAHCATVDQNHPEDHR